MNEAVVCPPAYLLRSVKGSVQGASRVRECEQGQLRHAYDLLWQSTHPHEADAISQLLPGRTKDVVRIGIDQALEEKLLLILPPPLLRYDISPVFLRSSVCNRRGKPLLRILERLDGSSPLVETQCVVAVFT